MSKRFAAGDARVLPFREQLSDAERRGLIADVTALDAERRAAVAQLLNFLRGRPASRKLLSEKRGRASSGRIRAFVNRSGRERELARRP